MPSPLLAVRARINTLWGEATPPTDATTPYGVSTAALVSSGLSGRRSFTHDPPASLTDQETGDVRVARYAWTAVLVFSAVGLTPDDLFDAVVEEGRLLQRLVDRNPDWPPGTVYVKTLSAVPTPADGDAWDLTIAIEAQVEEVP